MGGKTSGVWGPNYAVEREGRYYELCPSTRPWREAVVRELTKEQYEWERLFCALSGLLAVCCGVSGFIAVFSRIVILADDLAKRKTRQ